MKKILKTIFFPNAKMIVFYMIVVALVLYFKGIPILDIMELKTFDLRFLSRGNLSPSPEIVLAVIDEKSLDREGRWPWPRTTIARLIEKLSEDGAKVISFDAFFSEPDHNSNLGIIHELKNRIDSLNIDNAALARYLKQKELKSDNDLILAETIQNATAKIVLGYFFHMNQKDLKYDIDPADISHRTELINKSRYPASDNHQKNERTFPMIQAYAPEPNIEMLSDASQALGYINMIPDLDGTVRWMPLVIRCNKASFASLSIQTIWHYLDRPELAISASDYGIEGVQIGNRFIPTDEYGQILINYLGPAKTFEHYSISDILSDELPKGTFEKKIVMVGATSTGIYDMRNVPFEPVYPGLEIHATVVDNILKQNYLYKPNWTRIYDILTIIALGTFTGLILPKVRAFYGVLFLMGLFTFYILLTRWFFIHMGFWINIVYPLVTIVLIYISFTLYRYVVEEKNKRFLYTTFSSYLAPELIENMVQKGEIPELGGETRNITAYFTDIQNFSTISEHLTSQHLINLLNEYLTAMTDILIAENGTLDKYVGDAIIAVFGAPIHLPDHAYRACKVAISMQNRLTDLCAKWRQEKQAPDEPNRNIKNLPYEIWKEGDKWPQIVHNLRMRVGINTGEMVVGNIGSAIRMNYSMTGDAVNLAARLEQSAKLFGIYTLVSEYTLNTTFIDGKGLKMRVKDVVEARFIDNIIVKGKTEAVHIFELCAMKGNLSEQERALFKLFDKGIKHYFRRDWASASDCFSEASKLERFPENRLSPSTVYLKRCESHKDNPPAAPGEKWDGVWKDRRRSGR